MSAGLGFNEPEPHLTTTAPTDRQLTVLSCAAGLLATKRVIVTADGFKIEEYSRMRHFRAATVTFDNIEDVYRLLHLDPRPRSFVIRAMLRDGIAPDRVRRTLHPDPTTGEPAFFRPVRRAWAAFDWDSVPPPSGLDPVREPVEAGMWLRDLLPDPFPECACVVQATSGCGFKPGLRYRLWFVLSRALHGQEIEAWCADAPLDPVTLRDVEPIYTARPIIEGAPDPVPRRIVLLPGLADVVEVPERLPQRPQARRFSGTGEARTGSAGFAGHLARMGDGPGLSGFRGPMLSALAAYAATRGADALERDADGLLMRIAGVVAVAPKKPGRERDIARYLGDDHFGELVGWIAARQRQAEEATRAGAIIAAALTGRVAP